jgi:hypothetical protein
VNDKSTHVPGGKQQKQTLIGYIIPLIIKDGLARLDIRPNTNHELNSLPHVLLTSELEWDPTVLDDDNIERQHPDIDFLTNKSFDEYGHFRHRVNVQHWSYFNHQDGIEVDQVMDQCILHCQSNQDDHLSSQTN